MTQRPGGLTSGELAMAGHGLSVETWCPVSMSQSGVEGQEPRGEHNPEDQGREEEEEGAQG